MRTRIVAHLLALCLFTVPAIAVTGAVYGPPTPVLVNGRYALPTNAVSSDWSAWGPTMSGGSSEGSIKQVTIESFNPISVMSEASRALPGHGSDGSSTGDPAKGGLSTAINILILLTVIGLAPSIVLMTTCFVRMLIVLGFLKQAIGTQSIPPPQVVTALALFMTMLVMAPTVDRIQTEAIAPYQRGEIRDYDTLWNKGKQPLRDFMFNQIEATGNWSSLYMILDYRGKDVSQPENLTREDVDMVSLVPAYMLSELKTSFLMGFRVYLPFLVIDMVVSTMLISMSMMMLPPVLISLPFKILLFVLVDGWSLVVGNLMHSFSRGEAAAKVSLLISPHMMEGVVQVTATLGFVIA